MTGNEDAAPQGTDQGRVPESEPEPDPRIVEAVGVLSEALETTERARGLLYGFHQLTGHADLRLDDAVGLLRDCGQHALADEVERELVGRNVVPGRWTYQLVEEYDDGYYATFRRLEETVRGRFVQGRRHTLEAEMKRKRRTHGHPAHTAEPADGRG